MEFCYLQTMNRSLSDAVWTRVAFIALWILVTRPRGGSQVSREAELAGEGSHGGVGPSGEGKAQLQMRHREVPLCDLGARIPCWRWRSSSRTLSLAPPLSSCTSAAPNPPTPLALPGSPLSPPPVHSPALLSFRDCSLCSHRPECEVSLRRDPWLGGASHRVGEARRTAGRKCWPPRPTPRRLGPRICTLCRSSSLLWARWARECQLRLRVRYQIWGCRCRFGIEVAGLHFRSVFTSRCVHARSFTFHGPHSFRRGIGFQIRTCVVDFIEFEISMWRSSREECEGLHV